MPTSTTTSAAPASPSAAHTPAQQFGALFLAVTLLGVLLWVLCGLAVLSWMAWKVPIQPSDLRQASWLASPTLALHFSTGFMGGALAVTMLLMGTAIAIAKSTPVPFITGLVMATCLQFGLSPEAVVRIGVLDDVIKVGCFVPETSECRSLLGLSTQGYRSRYRATDIGESANSDHLEGPDAAWYQEARKQRVSPDQELRAALHSIPGFVVLAAPLHWRDAVRLQDKLAAQRAEVQSAREASQGH